MLYNSIYVADDQVLVNTHVYGAPAAQAPVWHLHKLAGGELTSSVPRELRAGLGIGDAVRGNAGHVARRIDFYDDPAAPKANSMVPSVNVVVTNDDGDVLLIRRSDNRQLGGARRRD